MTTETLDTWAIVEVMGHRQYAGRVTEQVIGGTAFVRVDVPESKRSPAFTKLIGASSIYAITPTTEEVARVALDGYRLAEPFSQLGLPDPAALIYADNNDSDGTPY